MTPGALVSWFGLIVAIIGLVWTERGQSARPRNSTRIKMGVLIATGGMTLIVAGVLLP